MPHLVLEISENAAVGVDLDDVLKQLYTTLIAAGMDAARIKARAQIFSHSMVGGDAQTPMVHARLDLLAGRDLAVRKKISKALYAKLRDLLPTIAALGALTLELREMDPATYQK